MSVSSVRGGVIKVSIRKSVSGVEQQGKCARCTDSAGETACAK